MNLDTKIETFTRRLAADPHSRVFAPLADLLRQAGRLKDALDLLDDGLGRHPEYIAALVIKGQTLLDAGQVDQARAVLNAALEKDGENIVVLRLLVADAHQRQALPQVLPLLEKLTVLEPDDPRWRQELDEARRLAASAAITETPAPEPLDADFNTMTLVDIYLAQGYREKALEALSQMAAREPQREDILRRIAEIEGQVPAGEQPAPRKTIPGVPAATAGDPGSKHAARRQNEKKQFEDWIARLRQEGGSSS
jgi:tetratricopeptide (TPR) repeat protein